MNDFESLSNVYLAQEQADAQIDACCLRSVELLCNSCRDTSCEYITAQLVAEFGQLTVDRMFQRLKPINKSNLGVRNPDRDLTIILWPKNLLIQTVYKACQMCGECDAARAETRYATVHSMRFSWYVCPQCFIGPRELDGLCS